MNNELELNFSDIAKMIETRRNNAYRKVNEELISLYWDFGKYMIVIGEIKLLIN